MLGYSQIHFLFFQKKDMVPLNGIVHILLPCECSDRGEEDF